MCDCVMSISPAGITSRGTCAATARSAAAVSNMRHPMLGASLIKTHNLTSMDHPGSDPIEGGRGSTHLDPVPRSEISCGGVT